jgi:heme/copper-type cytochrome/quinol oxidase subunit 3
MAEQTSQPATELDRAAEEAGFYHEAALNAAWTGSRFAIGALSFLYGAFAFAYFYLRSVNSNGRWKGSGYHAPQIGYGVAILALVVVSAVIQYVGLTRIKAGAKSAWQSMALAALVLGLVAVALQIVQLLNLPFQPGSSGFSSVFTGFYPVMLVSWLGAMIWLEILIMRARPLPAISFVEQPPTYAEAFAVQRFQSSLSAFTLIWNFIVIVTIIFFFLFYVAV